MTRPSFKDPSPAVSFLRSRTFLFVLLACGSLLGIPSIQLVRNARAREILEAEGGGGLTVSYNRSALHLPFGYVYVSEDQAHVSHVEINTTINNPEGVAWAIRQLGPITSLHLDAVDSQPAARFLRALGKQPKVSDLSLLYTELDEELCELLPNFPGVVTLNVAGAYTFERFPKLPNLQSCDLSSPLLNEAGWRAILRSPALTHLGVRKIPRLEVDALKALLLAATPSLKSVSVEIPGLTPEEAQRLHAQFREVKPDVAVYTTTP